MKFLSLVLMFCIPLNLSVAKEGDLKATMKNNFEALLNLQRYVADPKVFSDPKNRNEIQKHLDSISALNHVFPQKMADQEPGLAAIASLFSGYIKDIQKSFREGATGSFGRNRIRTLTGLCLGCHTRVGTSQSFTDIQNKADSMGLTDFQKAEFFAATRQFDKAIEAFDRILLNTSVGELGQIDFARAVREALSVTIRVKQDPQTTLQILNKIAGKKDVPAFFQNYVSAWKKDVETWAHEKKSPKTMTANELMAKAKNLINQNTSKQFFSLDPSGDVVYLRATNYLHEALQKDPKGKFRGEALYLLGSCYDALQDPLLMSLDTLYYEACVREFPHSAISKKCYQRYASKTYFGYSGSGGTFIPEDEVQKLSELRTLSE